MWSFFVLGDIEEKGGRGKAGRSPVEEIIQNRGFSKAQPPEGCSEQRNSSISTKNKHQPFMWLVLYLKS